MEKQILENYIKAGKIASQAREYGVSLIKEGSLLIEISNKIEEKILSLGGNLAFPVQISINNIAAHYCSTSEDKTVFKDGDLVKLDLGVHIEGYIGDTAISIDIGNNNKDLIKSSQDALDNAIKIFKPGTKLGDIGKTIEKTISSQGFNPVKNLSGHGVSLFNIHDKPSVPNYNTGDKTTLKKGMVLAIEPFATNGQGWVIERDTSDIFSLIQVKATRNLFTRQILKEILTYNGLPFSPRWLARKFPLMKVNYALKEMNNLGMLRQYPPLVEKDKGLVSQTEHTVIVDDEPIVITKSLN